VPWRFHLMSNYPPSSALKLHPPPLSFPRITFLWRPRRPRRAHPTSTSLICFKVASSSSSVHGSRLFGDRDVPRSYWRMVWIHAMALLVRCKRLSPKKPLSTSSITTGHITRIQTRVMHLAQMFREIALRAERPHIWGIH